MADWDVALEKQAATWAFLNSENGARFIEGFRASEIESDPENANINKFLHSNLTSTLWNAEPIYVTTEMMDLLEAAWPSFQPEIFHEEDMFLPWGFAYLARPIVLKDVRGVGVAHRAVAWQPARREEDQRPATYVSTWANMDDNVDEYLRYESEANRAAMRAYFGQAMALNYATPMMYGLTVHQMLEKGFEERAASYDQGTVFRGVPGPGSQEEIEHATVTMLSFLQCLWRMLGQQVAIGFKQRPPRAQRRRLERERFPEKYITVVTLRRPRRPAHEDDERHPVEWSQRWIVSGHWRWQPYKDGVRQIWISPYVKGPEDKPLVVRGARVFRLAR